MTDTSSHRPYLSIVVAVRNDNYGGDFNARLQNFLTWNTHLLEKYGIPSEIILVNWNPIPENISLYDSFLWPAGRKFVSYRIIEVDALIHQQFSDPALRKSVPLYEFIAKNVGLRRARAKYILCTNADILFSEETIRQLALQKLMPRTLYRATRIDFTSTQGTAFSEEAAMSKLTNIFLRTGSLALCQSGSLQFRTSLARFHDRLRRMALSVWMLTTTYRSARLFIFRHPFNACGDFALMDKETWLNGCAYQEATIISTHTDSIQLLTCLSEGIPVLELQEAYVYHQEHGRRFDFSVPDKEMDVMFVQLLKLIQLYLKGQKLSTEQRDWGLNGMELKDNQF